jgi:hypothetical protein
MPSSIRVRWLPALGLALLAGTGTVLASCGSGGGGDFHSDANVSMITTTLPSAATGAAYAAQFAADFPHPPGTFILKSGTLPPGLTLNNDTGELEGFPRLRGTFTFTIAARDGVDPDIPQQRDETFTEDSRRFVVPVALGTPNILPQEVPSATYRNSYSYPIQIAGGTPPYHWLMTGGGLPLGLSISDDGVLGSFPQEYQAAAYEFDVIATDANGLQDTAHLSVAVAILPLLILTSKVPQAAIDIAYDTTLVLASRGGGDPIEFSQAPVGPGEVSLASFGMAVTSSGHVIGTPTTLGHHLFTVLVKDEASQTTTRQFDLIVNPGPVLYSISPARSSQPGPFIATGLNLQPGAQLIFRPGPTQTSVTTSFTNSTKISFSSAPAVPGGAGGAVNVMVLNPDGGNFTLPNGFIFPAAQISFASKGFVSTGLSSTGLDCADVNGDLRADIITCGSNGWYPYSGGPTSSSPGLVYLRNSGAGTPPTFVATTLDGGSFYDCKFADLNTDGKLDIVAIGAGSIKVWLNGVSGNPLGTFTAGPTSSGPGGYLWPSQMTIGRFNNDAIPDICFGIPYSAMGVATYSYQNGRAYCMLGNGSGSFTLSDQAITSMPATYGVNGPGTMSCLDTDGDNIDEVVAGFGLCYYTYDAQVEYTPMTSSGTFFQWQKKGTVTAYYGTATGIAYAKWDGTTPGIIVAWDSPAVYGYRQLTMMSGPALATMTTLTTPSANMKDVNSIDADFDLSMDWAVATVDSGVAIYKGNGASQVTTLDAASGSPTVGTPKTGRIASGDIDGDGKPDILATTSCWCTEGMAAFGYGAYYALGGNNVSYCGDGASRGVVWWINKSQ